MSTHERLGQILIEIQNSDMSHFEELYESTKRTVYFELKNVGVPDQSIEDMIQEVYIKLLTNAASINNPQALFKWIKQVAYTSGINFVRAAVNQREYLIEEDGDYIFEDEGSLSTPIPMPEDIMENKETQRLVRGMINSLPTKQHRIFVAFYYNELSIRDIAGNMGVSESVVKTQLFRGRRAIESQVKDLEKKHHTRLFSLAPIPIFALLFGQDVFACELPQSASMLSGKILAQMARYENSINSAAQAGAAAGAGANAGALGIGAKVAIGVCAAVVAIGAGAGITYLNLRDRDPAPEMPPREIVSHQEVETKDSFVTTEPQLPVTCDFMDENGFLPGYEGLYDVLTFLAVYDFNYDSSITGFSEVQWDKFCNALLANSYFDQTFINDVMDTPWSIPVSSDYMEEFCYMVTGHHIPYNTNIFNEKYADVTYGAVKASSPYLFDYDIENISITPVGEDTWEISYDFLYAPSSMENMDGRKALTATIKANPEGGVNGYSIYSLSVNPLQSATIKE